MSRFLRDFNACRGSQPASQDCNVFFFFFSIFFFRVSLRSCSHTASIRDPCSSNHKLWFHSLAKYYLKKQFVLFSMLSWNNLWDLCGQPSVNSEDISPLITIQLDGLFFLFFLHVDVVSCHLSIFPFFFLESMHFTIWQLRGHWGLKIA